jgi:predicted nucleotide-binding protein
MTKQDALEKLNFLIQELIKLPQYQYNGNNSEFNKWLRKATRYIEQIFEKDRQTTDFIDIQFKYKPKQIINTSNSNQIFIVHGHDELIISQVSEVLTKLGLEPIILKDLANSGDTIIEKIENYLSN